MKILPVLLAVASTLATFGAEPTFHQLTSRDNWPTNWTVPPGYLASVASFATNPYYSGSGIYNTLSASIPGFDRIELIAGQSLIGPAQLQLQADRQRTAVVVIRLEPIATTVLLTVQRSTDLGTWDDYAALPVPSTNGFWRLFAK